MKSDSSDPVANALIHLHWWHLPLSVSMAHAI